MSERILVNVDVAWWYRWFKCLRPRVLFDAVRIACELRSISIAWFVFWLLPDDFGVYPADIRRWHRVRKCRRSIKR